MRFMVLENFFYGGELHMAAPLSPKIIDFPDDEVPNIRWRPLDAKAKAALDALAAKVKEETGNIHRVFNIPEEFVGQAVAGEPIEKPEPRDPDKLSAATVDALIPKSKIEKVAGAKGGRASDQEPS